MAYLAYFYALYLTRISNFRSETLYKDSQRLVEPEYAKNAISTNRYNVCIFNLDCHIWEFKLSNCLESLQLLHGFQIFHPLP